MSSQLMQACDFDFEDEGRSAWDCRSHPCISIWGCEDVELATSDTDVAHNSTKAPDEERENQERHEHFKALAVVCTYLLASCACACLGSVLSREAATLATDGVLGALAFLIWAYSFLFPEKARSKIEFGVEFYKGRPIYWIEGYLFQNKDIWKDQGGGRWPSMTDNFCSFFQFVVGWRFTMVMLGLVPTAMLANMMRYGMIWRDHMLSLTSHFTVIQSQHGLHQPLGEVVFEPDTLCASFNFVPLPYTICVAKVVILSFVQDVFIGVTRLTEEKRDSNLSLLAVSFSVFTLLLVVQLWVRGIMRALNGDFGSHYWEIYEGLFFYVNQQSAVGSLMLLVSKFFCECNIDYENKNNFGAPAGLGRLLSGKWRIPRLRTEHRFLFFWVGIVTLIVGYGPILLTHVMPITFSWILGIAYPFWAPFIFVLELGFGLHRGLVHDPLLTSLSSAFALGDGLLVRGATLHATVWQHFAAISFIVIIGVYCRKLLWELHANWRSSPDHPFKRWTSLTSTFNHFIKLFAWLNCARSSEQGTEEEKEPLSRSENDQEAAVESTGDRNREPHGPYGFNLACYQVLFTLPILAYVNAAISTAIAVYSGDVGIEEAWMLDFTSREFRPFMRCMFSWYVPWQARFFAWIGLM